jgi:hypothetical protein
MNESRKLHLSEHGESASQEKEKAMKEKPSKSKLKLKTTFPTSRKSNWVSNAHARNFVSENLAQQRGFRPPSRIQKEMDEPKRTGLSYSSNREANCRLESKGAIAKILPAGNPYTPDRTSVVVRESNVRSKDSFDTEGTRINVDTIGPRGNEHSTDRSNGTDRAIQQLQSQSGSNLRGSFNSYAHPDNRSNQKNRAEQQMLCQPVGKKPLAGAAAADDDDDDDLFNDDDEDDRPKYAYQEVVRKKAEREALPAHDCPECAQFRAVVMSGKGKDVFNEDEIMACSRHRSRAPPPSTPPQYWELSFADEVEARKKREKEAQRQQAWWRGGR